MSDDFVSNDYEEFCDVSTYLGLCKKYPEAREDLLNLRRQKNTALYITVAVGLFFGLFIGMMVPW